MTTFGLLEQGIADPEKERYLRIRAWWEGNGKQRGDLDWLWPETNQPVIDEPKDQIKHPLSDKETRNLQALAEILNETDANDRLMKGEIMRELSRFDAASALLEGPFEEGLLRAVAIIKKLIEKRDPFVAEMRFD